MPATQDHRQHILLVDDHAMLRDAVTMALTNAGYTVHGTSTGSEAAQWIESYGLPDLVLLDINLPGNSGLNVLATLKQKHPVIKVAILSGADDPVTVSSAMAGGACGFVTKALGTAALVTRVGELLGGVQSITTTSAAWNGAGVNACGLTPTQKRVKDLILQGKSNREIGVELKMAEGTVKTHAAAVCKAHGVSTRSQLLSKLLGQSDS